TARAVNGDLQFAKPALDPTSPKYFQVEAHQVDLGKFPDGLRVGSTESPLSADSDITLADGRIIPQGKLPTGVQVAGDTIHTPPDGVTLSNGTVLHDGMTIPDGAALSGGQQVGSGDWVLTRNTTLADGTPGYDMYTPHNDQMLARWKPVAGQPGQFSPNSVPTDMGFIPSGKVEIPTSWGTAKGEGPMFIAKYGEGDYNIITWKDATEHGYLDLPTNQAAEDFIGQPARVALMGSPEDLISWLHNI
ncbi:MAG TPA: hypothetical protein V6C72_12490, partial [Chroococcales cyanobacterium]